MALKPTLSDNGPTIFLEVGDDLRADSPAGLQLRLRFDEWLRGDEIIVTWDGEALPTPDIRFCSTDDPTSIGQFDTSVWYRFEMNPASAAPGRHRVRVDLVRRHPRIAADLVLTDA